MLMLQCGIITIILVAAKEIKVPHQTALHSPVTDACIVFIM